MHIVTLDFETFWSKTHTLKKMDPLSYVMHEDTEIISCSVAVGSSDPECVFGEDEVVRLLRDAAIPRALVVAHNMSAFDSYLLTNRLGFVPRMYGCTQAMARPHFAKTVGLSLAALVKHFKIGVKDSTALLQTQGKNLADFSKAELQAMAEYNNDDTAQCRQLFNALKGMTPRQEFWAIDSTVRMRATPRFIVDTALLNTALSVERDQKRKLLYDLSKELGIVRYNSEDDTIRSEEEIMEEVRATVASAPKFAELLEAHGVPVPMKVSPTTGKEIPALAKTDQEFLGLLEHDDEVVATAVRCRLSEKSTLLETRIGKFLDSAANSNGALPIPIRYCGADTTGRDSGEYMNPQNLPRVDPRGPKTSDALRNSIMAPDGYVIIVADLSGIELRVNHFLWKVPSSMELYCADPEADLYRAFAADRYNVTPGEVTSPQRQLAKIAQLGLGFGAGPVTFRNVAKTMGGLDLSENEAREVTYDWRRTYKPIVDGWAKCHSHLPDILAGNEVAIDPWGLCTTFAGGIRLPSGRAILYPALRFEHAAKGREWWYGEGRHKARIYAGKIDENCVQALARDIVFDYALEFFNATGLYPSLRVHDELVYVVEIDRAKDLLDTLQGIMRTPPKWWPELVTWSEGDTAKRYGAAK